MSHHSLRSTFLWLVFGLCWCTMIGVCLHCPTDAHAQEEVEEREEEELAEDGNGYLRELKHVRRMLQGRLEDLADETKLTKERIKSIDDMFLLIGKAGELEGQIESAEATGKPTTKLMEQLCKYEAELEFRGEMIELEFQLFEATEELEEAEDDEDEERYEIIELLLEGLRKIRSINADLLPIYLNGNESKEGPLKARKAEVFSNRVEKPKRALHLLEELREAEEEEDEERIEELEEELEELREEIEGYDTEEHDAGGKDQKSSKTSTKPPPLQPIVVNDETLSPFVASDLKKDVVPLLKRYCFDCHGNDESSGELNFEKLLANSPIVKNRDQWVNVIEQSKNHVMPPEDAEQPTRAEREKIVLSLHNAIYRFDYSDIKDPGFESARRMTHREYSNTVRDLFGIAIDVVDRFPDDLTATSGFDNSANSLFIQPLLMERYIGIAEHVVNSALPTNSRTDRSEEQRKAFTRTFVSVPVNADGIDFAAGKVMRKFLLRAYRRPATDAEVQRFTKLIVKAAADGASFEEAVTTTLQTVLITPSFLLRIERDRPSQTTPFAIDDWAMASRLSYFLWASMPDDELLELAQKKQLQLPTTLTAQVARMIADPKSRTLGTVFAAQWLGSQHLGVRTRLDPIDNPWCTETLMAAMRDETSMFFNTLVQENRPITELVDADYTYLNEELAKLYRVRGVAGKAMRRVGLETKQRGGIFGHGSLLAVTSFPGRTSPVVRGKWILDTVLGTPPPPPPPNVSELSEEIEENRRLSFREKLELHREKPNCYACHSEMDPLGFSLENYDWFGRFRSRRGRSKIDSTGQLPNGTEFQGLAGLKRVIVEQRKDDLVRQVTQKLLAYALGRQLEYYDEPAIQKILAKVSTGDDKMQTLVREIVLSYPFRFKQNRRDESERADNQVRTP